jgi:hypothetical protein
VLIRVQEHQVKFGHRDQAEEVSQDGTDDHVLDDDVESVLEVNRRHRQRPRVPEHELAQRSFPRGGPHVQASTDHHRVDSVSGHADAAVESLRQ